MPIFRRLPKRGFTNAPFKKVYSVVNIGDLEARFEGGAHVTPQALKEQGLIRHLRHPVKILGEGELTKKLKIDAAKFSRTALEKINAVGGEARITGRRGEVVPATMPEPKKKEQPEAEPKAKGKGKDAKAKDGKAKGDKAKADKGGDSKAKGDKKKADEKAPPTEGKAEKPADAGAAEAKREAADGAKAEDAPKDEKNEQEGENK
jgi:hypothetical protein